MAPATCEMSEEELDEMAVGHMQIGSIHFSWDFSELRRQAKYEQRAKSVFRMESGRLLMPSLGIL